jgi:hypothetical protein
MTLQLDLDGGGIAIRGKAANFRGEEGKKNKNKTKYRSCGVPTIANKTIYSMFCIVVMFFF